MPVEIHGNIILPHKLFYYTIFLIKIQTIFFVFLVNFTLIVTVHSVLSNTLRDAQNLC